MISRKDFLRLAGRGAAASAVASAFGRPGPAAAQTPAARRLGSKEQKGPDVPGTTDAVVRFITTASMREFPAEVVQQGKRCLVDGFGVILAGSPAAGTAIVRRSVKAARG